jgi:hypothetical protein
VFKGPRKRLSGAPQNFAAVRRYWSKILRDVMRPNSPFCHLIGVLGIRTRQRQVYSTGRVQLEAPNSVLLLCEV